VSILVLNRRRIIDRIPHWLSDVDAGLVLVTARGVASQETFAQVAPLYEDIAVVDKYDGPEFDAAVRGMTARHRITRVVSAAEVDVMRAARVRAEVGLPGQTLESALAYRDKVRMKSAVAIAGVPVATMRPLTHPDELSLFAQEVGFPLVVKPLAGAGSVGVLVIHDAFELKRLLTSFDRSDALGATPLVAEAWVDGEMCEVDGLLAGRQVLQCWPARMRQPNLATVAQSAPLSTWMLPQCQLATQLRCFIAAVVSALPSPEEPTAFHAEVFRRHDGTLLLNEIACRPGGAGIVPMYERALGVNLYETSLRGQAGCPPPPAVTHPNRLAGYVFFPPRAGRLRALPSTCSLPGVYSYVPTGRVGSRYCAPGSISDNVAQVGVEGPADEDLDGRMANVESWWNTVCMWEDHRRNEGDSDDRS
jgi:phosphoribosylaminoimidazole carboxylase (NCAIR synthetase)